MLLLLLQWWPGNLSDRDFIADLAGIALAAAGILAYYQLLAAPAPAPTALASLVSRLKPSAAAYRPVPTDIEMGAAPAQGATAAGGRVDHPDDV
jgi:hypothetical protein